MGMVTFQEHDGLLLARVHGDQGEAAKLQVGDDPAQVLDAEREVVVQDMNPHVDVFEDDEESRVTLFFGLDRDVEGGVYALVGFVACTQIRVSGPVATRRIRDGVLDQEGG